MIAVQNDKVDVVETMISKDSRILGEKIKAGVTMLHWAMENGYSTFFKVNNKHMWFVLDVRVVILYAYFVTLTSTTSGRFRVVPGFHGTPLWAESITKKY